MGVNSVINQGNAEELVADGLVSIAASAKFLSVSIASIYNLMGRGELPFVKIGRSRRIPRRALVRLAADQIAALEKEI